MDNDWNPISPPPPIDLRLTREVASEYLSHHHVFRHEVLDMLFGMIPYPGEQAGSAACLDPGDNAVVRRILAEEKAGRLAFPLRIDEFSAVVIPWRNELTEELVSAFELRLPDVWGVTDVQRPAARKNSAVQVLAEVKRAMTQVIDLIETAGMTCQPDLPGTKEPYRKYVRQHSKRARQLGDDALDKYFKQCGYRWRQTGGHRDATDGAVSVCLGICRVDPS